MSSLQYNIDMMVSLANQAMAELVIKLYDNGLLNVKPDNPSRRYHLIKWHLTAKSGACMNEDEAEYWLDYYEVKPVDC